MTRTSLDKTTVRARPIIVLDKEKKYSTLMSRLPVHVVDANDGRYGERSQESPHDLGQHRKYEQTAPLAKTVLKC